MCFKQETVYKIILRQYFSFLIEIKDEEQSKEKQVCDNSQVGKRNVDEKVTRWGEVDKRKEWQTKDMKTKFKEY